ncbi:MAG: polymerase sigma-70 factor [Myxococcaceae bacterium]|nr:polymerase sigma-70 factor [Myxococcaceae bacterium]
MSEHPRADSTGMVEHYFRHEYGRLVSTLARVFGVPQIETIEDAVQDALQLALDAWALKGVPADPAAWLYRVSYNRVIDVLRSARVRARSSERSSGRELAHDQPPPRFQREIADDLLRMLFVCCDQAVPAESQLVLALKTLCGFSVAEIATRLFISEANVWKRLERARLRLCALEPDTDTLDLAALQGRLGSVHAVIYLLFNEGYHSLQADNIVRRELCDEALRLAILLAEHPSGAVASTYALLALMHFHTARLASRVDQSGALLLLEEQDRTSWDRSLIDAGCAWLERSASGDSFSRYHAEAGIAAEHCLATSFAATRWSEIADLYLMLEQLAPSPLHVMNRAVALAQVHGPALALALLAEAQPPGWVRRYYLWHAVLGELHRQAGQPERAREHLKRALSDAPTEGDRALLRKRLLQCDSLDL